MVRTREIRLFALLAVLAALLALPSAAAASRLTAALGKQMRVAGPYSGAYVVDPESGKALFSWKAGTPRVLASNTKLFTTAAALGRWGSFGTFQTRIVAEEAPNDVGVVDGDVWLVGGGDPAFGARSYVRKRFGAGGADVEGLVEALQDAGVTSVRGGVHGDESLFDRIRGIRDSGYGVSGWVGPLSALTFNHGWDGRRFQASPPKFAMAKLRSELKSEGITPGHAASASKAPESAVELAVAESLPMRRLVRLTNKDSDNFFAEMLLKNLGTGTTSGGARAASAFARQAGARVTLYDGSGLDRGNRASPRDVAKLLAEERSKPEFPDFYASLPIAGVDGTLYDRMEHSAARRNCRGKTGSLIGVSALSGYCTTRSGRELVFSFLMNGVSTYTARRLQDRMAAALVVYG